MLDNKCFADFLSKAIASLWTKLTYHYSSLLSLCKGIIAAAAVSKLCLMCMTLLFDELWMETAIGILTFTPLLLSTDSPITGSDFSMNYWWWCCFGSLEVGTKTLRLGIQSE